MTKEVTSVQLPPGKIETQSEEAPKDTPASGDPTESQLETPAVSDEPAEVPEAPESGETQEAVDDTNKALEPYIEKIGSGEKLTDDDLGAIAEAIGTTPEVVEYTYRGMIAAQQDRESAAVEAAGGLEAYKEMVTWASTVYTAEEAQAFNDLLAKGKPAEVAESLRNLRTKFTEVNGSPKSLVTKSTAGSARVPASSSQQPSGNTPNGSSQLAPFRSMAEQRAAQQDPRYGTDVAYTKDVYQRVALSNYR